MMYYTETFHKDYLLPNLVGITCDFCKTFVEDPDILVDFEEVDTDEGPKDMCPKCQKHYESVV